MGRPEGLEDGQWSEVVELLDEQWIGHYDVYMQSQFQS
jgi:hypothetical protein